MRESKVERHLCDEVKRIGGETRKLQWVNRANAPDQLVMYRGPWFVEVKRPGKSPTPAQTREHTRMSDQGLWVGSVSTLGEVDTFICMLENLPISGAPR